MARKSKPAGKKKTKPEKKPGGTPNNGAMNARTRLHMRTILTHIGGGGAVRDLGRTRPIVAVNTMHKIIYVERSTFEYMTTHGFLKYDPNESTPFCQGFTRTEEGRVNFNDARRV